VTFGTASAAATSVTFPEPGTYQLTLTVNDGSASGTDVVQVMVSPAVYPAADTDEAVADHGWQRVAAADVGMNQAMLDQATAYALTGGGSGMIVRHGRLVHSWGDLDVRYDLKSTTKSVGGIALGLAIDDHLLALTDVVAQTRLASIGNPPVENVATGWLDDITVLQLATHTAGFDKPGDYQELRFQPGTTWFYSDSGLNWLAEVLTAVNNQDLATLLAARVWPVLGIDGADPANADDLRWRPNQFRPNQGGIEKRELASGIFTNVHTLARVGLLYLRDGVWANNQRVVSKEFTDTVRKPSPSIAGLANPDEANFPGATSNYGVLWWTNAGGLLPNVPKDAFWAWGLGDSLIVVIPSLDLVITRAGPQQTVATAGRTWNDSDWNGDYTVLAPFLDPIVQSVTP
jgi:CubicO group peptidase (beta-lactamase class C family)